MDIDRILKLLEEAYEKYEKGEVNKIVICLDCLEWRGCKYITKEYIEFKREHERKGHFVIEEFPYGRECLDYIIALLKRIKK